jgi:hypothetical protein
MYYQLTKKDVGILQGQVLNWEMRHYVPSQDLTPSL